MDTLTVAVASIPFHRSDIERGEDVAIVRVNGRDLLELVDEFERPLAERGGFAATSSYDVPPARAVLPPSAHWLGDPAAELSRGDWALICTCGCGDWGCGGLLARIDAGEHVVTWSDFQTPFSIDWNVEHPGEQVQGDISRSGFGPFRFARSQYESAMRNPLRVHWPYGRRRNGRARHEDGPGA